MTRRDADPANRPWHAERNTRAGRNGARKERAMRMSSGVLVVAVAVLASAGPSLWARGDASEGIAYAGDEMTAKETTSAKETKKSVDKADVYVGDAAKWDKPAEVDADRIYAKIEEYREIVDGKLKPDDPKYELLMCKASKRFRCAVKKAAKNGSYDLVAKIGAVKGVSGVPDITANAIEKL
jgi:hypothetical protein